MMIRKLLSIHLNSQNCQGQYEEDKKSSQKINECVNFKPNGNKSYGRVRTVHLDNIHINNYKLN